MAGAFEIGVGSMDMSVYFIFLVLFAMLVVFVLVGGRLLRLVNRIDFLLDGQLANINISVTGNEKFCVSGNGNGDRS